MAGIGSRFLNDGFKDPKPLIDINGERIIHGVIKLFSDVENVSFICNDLHLKNTEMETILKEISPNCKIYKVINESTKGPVDTILQSDIEIDDDLPVIISYCDFNTVWDFEKFLHYSESNNLDGVIVCYKGFHPHMLGSDNYAFCKMKDSNLVEKVQEKKPFTENRMEEWASNGIYYFKSGSIFRKYSQKLKNVGDFVNGELYVSMIYNHMISDNLKVGVFEIEKMIQLGTPTDLKNYNFWYEYFNFDRYNQKIIDCPKNTTLILPLAGKGNRFFIEGYEKPKPMIEVNNNIMVVESVLCLPNTNNKVFISLKEHNDLYGLNKIIEMNFNNSKIIELHQITEGQAITCEIGIKKTPIDYNDPILISACDNGIIYDTDHLQNLFEDTSIDVIVWSFRNNQSSNLSPNSYTWLDVDDLGFINRVYCKKFMFDDPLKSHAIVGTMFFRKSKLFLDSLMENKKQKITTNGEYYVDDVLNSIIEKGFKVKVFEVKKYICWGTPNDYKTYKYWSEYFSKKK